MGLSWQQGPLGRNPIGSFIGESAPPSTTYAEPLRRRMSVEFGGRRIATSDNAVLLFEPARYPVAYFPLADIAPDALGATERVTDRPGLGATRWFTVRGADGRQAERAAWQHIDLPPAAGMLADTVAFAWRAMDGFYEEDERILGHAADPYHRIDIRKTSRHLTVHHEDRLVAETHQPLVLYESGFAPRWYVPREAVVAEALELEDLQTFCPYKGVASYYDIEGVHHAAWSYRAPLDEMSRIADLVSFEPGKLTVTIDGERLLPAPGQDVVAHGPDRDLSIEHDGRIAHAS